MEAYDLLRDIYLERGYRLRDIPRLILAKNLFGLDIDDRAAQLAGFALLMKARADDRRIFEGDALQLNVYAIQESAALNAAELAAALLNVKSRPRPIPLVGEETLWSDMSVQPTITIQPEARTAGAATALASVSREDVIELIELFKQGKTLGSLISIPESLAQKLPAIAQMVSDNLHSDDLHARAAANALLPFVQQAEVLARKYDCVIANPPYMGSRYFNPVLKSLLNKPFRTSNADLYGCFIIRSIYPTKQYGHLGMITIPNWINLSAFAELRAYLLEHYTFLNFVHIGRGVWGSDFGSCSFVMMNLNLLNFIGVYKRLFDVQGVVLSSEELNKRFFEKRDYLSSSHDFKKVPGYPIAYHVSAKVRDHFASDPALGDIASSSNGIRTGDNPRFVRTWSESLLAFSKTT